MTAQIQDSVLYGAKKYALSGINGEGLFDPSEYGMDPKSWFTACWRGYVSKYQVRNKTLTLDALEVSLTELGGIHDDQPAPVINGISASMHSGDEFAFSEYYYDNLNLRIPFTGGLLLTADFIEDLYEHMGYHPAWKYRLVHELIFETGILVTATDVSPKLDEIRKGLTSKPPEGNEFNLPREFLEWAKQYYPHSF